MAISQQTLQNVEFLELRRVFKKETDDIVKTDEKILDVLKDNNALLKDLIDKIELTSITKGLGKLKKPKTDKEDEEDTGFKPNFFKEFATGFGKRLEEYKEFFFGKKAIPKIEGKPLVEMKDQALKSEVLEQPKLLSLEEKVPTPKFEGKGEMQQVYPKTPLLEAPKPIAPLMLEGPKKKQYDDVIDVTPIQSKTPLIEAPKPIAPLMLEGPKKKQYDDVIDVTPIQSKTPLLESPKSSTTLIENKSKTKSSAPLLLEGPKKVESAPQSGMIPSKLVDDIASIRKAVLSDGVLVKVINTEEFKSVGAGEEKGGVGALDVLKSGLDVAGGLGGKGAEKAGSKVGKFLGMAGKAARVLGPAAAIAGAAYSGFEGYQNTASNFDLKEGEEATLGQKVSSTLGGIASGATFGLLNEKTAAQGIQKAGEFVGGKASAAYEGVKSLGGKAVSAVGGFFGGIGDNVRNAFTKGLDEKKGVTQADQLVSTYMSPTDSQESSASGVLSKSNLTEGITSEKTVLGSTFLGKLFSKKGTTTGQFLGQSTNQSLLEANQDVGEHGNVSNLSKISSSTMLGKREAGGILSKDKYSIYSASDGKEETTDLTRTEYNKIQKLVETGKVDEAQSTLQKIKDKREIDKQNAQIYGRTPEDMVTPMSELSRTNEELKRQSSTPINLPPVVSNTVQTNNTQTLSPIKAQPRSAMGSALERYIDKVSVFA